MPVPASVPLLTLLALAAQEPSDKARKLFVTNCATCHGETGDGQGVTKLDRPARSFKDGGFSFGNTPEQLFRTITTGIPGTPMPGFDASIPEEDRKLLAGYVVTLGPPIEEVKIEDMVLSVHDRPLVVRGKLPSLGEGLPEHPRGLLIGDPSGITFEYTVDDVRLLALRQGGFVQRTDWTGRGGTALEPLGKVVTLVQGGKPEATFSLAAGAIPLTARLSGSRIEAPRAVIGYHLTLDGREIAHVEESPSVVQLKTGTGFSRAFSVVGGTGGHLALFDPTQVGKGRTWIHYVQGSVHHFLAKPKDAQQFHELAVEASTWSRKWNHLILELGPGERAAVDLTELPVSAWDEAMKTPLEGHARALVEKGEDQ